MKLYVSLFILSIILSCTVTYASEKTDFRVNDDLGSAEQNDPRIAVAADGSSVIVWVDKRNQSKDIYLQKFDPDGIPIGMNFRINDDTLDAFQALPSVGTDINGLYRVVWQDYRNGFPLEPGIFYQRFDSTLMPISTNVNITASAVDQQRESPDIAVASDGRGVIVWADYRNGNWDIYGQLLDFEGSPVGSNFRVNLADAAAQHSPRVAMGSQGWFVVCWYDNRLGNDDVYAQPFDTSGVKIDSVLKINNDVGSERQIFPDVAADGLGRYTVVWVDYRNSHYPNNPDIYATKLDTNGVYLASNIMLNSDETTRAQKYPSIAADRMGNVAIIWSDSTFSSWDIVGQMIDVDGVVREVNFQANSSSDSAQFKADVALDGQFRYITWVDSREDRLFDIYASVTQYNERSLLLSPTSLTFEMERGSGLPAPQAIAVEHSGYNAISYGLTVSSSWLTAVANTGTTPDSFVVSITDSSLPKGTHLSEITLSDPLDPSSFIVLPVHLEVLTPILSLSSDTVRFIVPEGIDRDDVKTVRITNSGVGELIWDAIGGETWLSVSNQSGIAPDTFELIVNGFGLAVGSYVSDVQIRANDADNSPDTIHVIMDVRNDLPTISVSPNNMVIETGVPELVDTFIVISNVGLGLLNWNASTAQSWVSLDSWFGNNNDDTIHIQLDGALLGTGYYAATLYLFDSASVNITDSVMLDLTVVEGRVDSIRIEPTQFATDDVGFIPITFVVTSNVNQLFLPLIYDSQYLTVDSILPMMTLPNWMSFDWQVDGVNSELRISLNSTNPDSSVISGEYPLAVLAVTTYGEDMAMLFQTAEYDSIRPYIVTETGLALSPAFDIAPVRIGNPTDIGDVDPGILPNNFRLLQNYPNPFNAGTQIPFELPIRSHVTLTIFDILGREVSILTNQSFSSGSHLVSWNGLMPNGREASSGIYFYRLIVRSESGKRDQILSKKLLLLK